jgi:hypothetical protein
MSEIYGPSTYRASLEADMADINPDCHCTQSKMVRARGVKLALNGFAGREEVRRGVAEVLEGCPRSEAKTLCCDVIQKCTNIAFIGQSPEVISQRVDTAVENVNKVQKGEAAAL